MILKFILSHTKNGNNKITFSSTTHTRSFIPNTNNVDVLTAVGGRKYYHYHHHHHHHGGGEGGRKQKKLDNPFFEQVERIRKENPAFNFDYAQRAKFARKYSFALPTDNVIHRIVHHNPNILEIGASTGYWSFLLHQANADVVAVDIVGNKLNHSWFPVQEKMGEEVTKNGEMHHRQLLYVWPSYFPGLEQWNGNVLTFVGEKGGVTADFFQIAQQESGECKWQLVEEISLPSKSFSPSIHDACYIFKRRMGKN